MKYNFPECNSANITRIHILTLHKTICNLIQAPSQPFSSFEDLLWAWSNKVLKKELETLHLAFSDRNIYLVFLKSLL